MVKVGSDGGALKMTSQCTDAEIVDVLDEMIYSPFEDLDGKASDRGRVCCSCLLSIRRSSASVSKPQ